MNIEPQKRKINIEPIKERRCVNAKENSIGGSDFKDLIEGNNYFIDKSLLIK